MQRHVRRMNDDGTVVVMTAVLVPVVLLVIALAVATLVWAASESETQRAADKGAVESAASMLLADFPYSQVTTLGADQYPTASSVATDLGLPAPDPQLDLLGSGCSTIGDPTTAIQAAQGLLTTTADGLLTATTGAVATVSGTINGLVSPSPAPLLGQAAVAPQPVTLLPTLSPAPLPTVSTTLLPTIDPTAVTTLLPSATPTATATPLPTATPTLPPSTTPTAPPGCAGLDSVAPIPPVAPSSKREACSSAEEAMQQGHAPYANNFFGGTDPAQRQATCANGRVRVGLATLNPLLGFSTSTVDAATDGVTPSVSSSLSTVQQTVAPLGVHLDTALPNLICPQVNVEVDQPVEEPIFQHDTTPNGRATARRVVKNAVVVPVFNGLAVASASATVSATASGTTPVGSVETVVSGGTSTSVILPAVDLNPTLLAAQTRLLSLLDGLDAGVQSALTAVDAQVEGLNGTLSTVPLDSGATLPAPGAATRGSLDPLSLTSCLKQTLTQLFDPPNGDAPTTDEALAATNAEQVAQTFADAAASGDPIELIQVGAVPCAGATMDPTTGTFSCLQRATGTTVSTVTGLYDVPFFDVTPVIVRDVGGGHYQAVPVHASQATGAFRATLVRASDNTRYVPAALSRGPAAPVSGALGVPGLPDAWRGRP